MKTTPIAWTLFLLFMVGIVPAQSTYVLLSEDFESLPLGASVEEAVGTPDVWTDTPPDGWSIDESGVPGVGDPATDGMTEWAGWAFTNKDWWIQVAGDQRRVEFTLGEGTIAVADPDEWDDATHPGPNSEDPFDTWLSTLPIDLSTVRPGTLQLTFDSSWRPEYDDDYHQTANITVSFDGAEPIELLRWESNSASPNFKDDNSTNETIVMAIDNPQGASSMVLTFGLFDAGNDWWWAIDNIVVTGERLAERAFNPRPENADTGLPDKTVLSWTPGAYVDGLSPKHKVLLSDDINAVKDGSAVVSTQDANSLDTTGLLDFSTTYYWRIDEANGVSGWDEGSIWTFSIEPRSFAVPVGAVSATATSTSAGQGSDNLINGSGLNENDEHSNLQEFMWLGGDADGTPSVTFEFDNLEKLDNVHIWNHNTQTESILGFGFKETRIESSVDGETWSEVATLELAQATGMATYAGEAISLGGVVARYIKMTALSNYSLLGLPQKGLAEVRFYAIPMRARYEVPADGLSAVQPLVDLQWRAGRDAVKHEVWMGTEPEALTHVATVDESAYTLAAEIDSPLYWQINEVNDAADPAVWEGDLWSFTTAAFAIVDNMDTYRSEDGHWVWETWQDGFGDDNNGALLGHNGDDMETGIQYDGRQSLPFYYGQGGVGNSEASRDIDRDWGQHGIQSLSLMFQGSPANTPGQLYVKVNDTEIATYPTSSDLTLPQWFAWTIDLPASALRQVDTLAIGVKGGTGMVLIDAIRLYARASETLAPEAPTDTDLLAYYAFEGNYNDASGNGFEGVPVDNASLLNDPGRGQVLSLDGFAANVDLGAGDAFNPQGSFSISAWANIVDFTSDWGHCILSKQGEGDAGWQLRRHSGSENLVFTLRGTAGADDPQGTVSMVPFYGEWVHIAGVYQYADTEGGQRAVYVNGLLDVSIEDANAVAPSAVNTYIGARGNRNGDGTYEAAGFFNGMLDEIRIYQRALTQGEALGLAGRQDPIFLPF